jgi:hypothetical protein
MGETQGSAALGKNALIASIIEAVAGVAWIESGMVNLAGKAWIAARVIAGVIGVVLLARGIRLRRTHTGGVAEPSMFASRGYRLVVAAEAVAMAAGGIALGLTHQGGYLIAWFGLVVGVHFLGFGKLFARRFYLLGAALIVGAAAGLVAGVAGGDIVTAQALTGFICGLSLFAMSAFTLVQYQGQRTQVQPA